MIPRLTFNPHKLVSPVPLPTFLRQFWTKQPLLLQRSDPQYYRKLVALGDLETILNTPILRFPSIQAVRRGTWIPPNSYTYDLAWGDQHFRQLIDPEKLLQTYSRGATLVFQALHLHCGHVGVFCRAFQERIGFATTANGYVTPPNSKGFARHSDLHEVFILQISGKKKWKFQSSKGHARSVLLKEGDLLYLPKGTKHQASTGASVSAHVTIAIDTLNSFEILRMELETYRSHPTLAAVIPAVSEVSGTRWDPQARKALFQLAAQFQPAHRLRQFQERLRASHPDFRYRLDHQLKGLKPTTRIRLRRGLSLRTTKGGQVEVESALKIIVLPSYTLDALKVMTEKSTVTITELPRLTVTGRLVLIRLLAKENLLEILSPGH